MNAAMPLRISVRLQTETNAAPWTGAVTVLLRDVVEPMSSIENLGVDRIHSNAALDDDTARAAWRVVAGHPAHGAEVKASLFEALANLGTVVRSVLLSDRGVGMAIADGEVDPRQGLGWCHREYSILWGSLRRQSDCLVVVRRAKAELAMTERVFERIV